MYSNKYTSILNKIFFKPLIMETIFPLLLNRPCILYNLISKDDILKKKLNKIFSNVKKKSNKLGKEFSNNLERYSLLKDMNDNLQKWLDAVKNKKLTYKFLKKELNFSFLKYLYSKLNIYNYNIKNGIFYNKNALKGIVIDFYSSLKNASVMLDNFNKKINDNIDIEYLQFIDNAIENSKDNNKITQKVKLVLIVDENQIFDIKKIKNKITKYPYINEIELIFNDDIISTEKLLIFFNSYLSDIEHPEYINKLMLHNKLQSDFSKINISIYQSLVSYLFDNIYSEKNENIKYQLQLLKNLKEINIENIHFLYIYERMKLYYYINDFFILSGPKKNIYYIHDKTIIFSNKIKEMKIDEIISSIEYHLNNNKKIEYFMFVNHKKLIQGNTKINKINISKFQNLKEFIYISKELDNLNELFDISLSINKGIYYKNIYEGYNKDNILILYREGEEQIQSFDLIDLFKYNKNLTKIELINEKIQINYDEERTKLEIINIGQIKKEISSIINFKYLNISHFSKFIFKQDSLKELTINGFDINLIDIINNNINTLNLNYEKNLSLLKYFINTKNFDNKLEIYFPKLISLNIGGDCKNVFCSLNSILTQQIKKIGILTKKKTTKYISKVFKKINNYKINKNIEFFDDINDISEDNKTIKDNFEEEGNEEYEEYEEDYEENYEYKYLEDIKVNKKKMKSHPKK